MPGPTIRSDTTIADVLPTLDKPEHYVRGVLENLYLCKREWPSATVRIGITGRGIVPHYRVEYPAEAAGTPMPGIFDAFNGRNHKKLADEDVLRDEHWSSRAMTLEQVRDLLGQIRANGQKRN
jgi:hypothetical protein